MEYKWRGLAWDDEYREEDNSCCLSQVMKRLRENFRIDVIATDDRVEFFQLFKENGPWDFLILDVIDNTSHPEEPDPEAGVKLGRQIRELDQRIPIVFLTLSTDWWVSGNNPQQPILAKMKLADVQSLVIDIEQWVASILIDDPRKVFVIYGHEKKTEGIKDEVLCRLEKHALEYIAIQPKAVMASLSEQLVADMRRCRTVVAICTPDDKVGKDWYQPRQNVLLEMGMALGMGYGFQQMVVLQRWGWKAEEKAQLPSDLGGLLTIRIRSADNHEGVLDEMIAALRDKGARITARQDTDDEI